MPCYTAPHSYCNHDHNEIENIICGFSEKLRSLNTVINNDKDYLKDIKNHSNKLTDMLCRVLNHLECQNINIFFDNDIIEWWENHKKWDKERKK